MEWYDRQYQKSSSLTLDGVTEKMMIYLARYTIPKYD